MFGFLMGKTDKLISDAVRNEGQSDHYLANVLLRSNFNELDRVPAAAIQRCYKAVNFYYTYRALLAREKEINLNSIIKYLRDSGVDFPDPLGEEIDLYIRKKDGNLHAPKPAEWILSRLDQLDSPEVLKGTVYAHTEIMHLDAYWGRHIAPIKMFQFPDFGATSRGLKDYVHKISGEHRSELLHMYLNLFSYFLSCVESDVFDNRSHKTPDYQDRIQELYKLQATGEVESIFSLAEKYLEMKIYTHENPSFQPSFHHHCIHNETKGCLKHSINVLRILNSRL